jgi:hypothetical protein
MKLAIAEAFLLDETVVLVPEIIIVFKFLLGEYFKEFRVDRVRVAEGLNSRKRCEILEIVVCVR